jgi:Na+-driven multidrug efflux pump
VELMSKPAGTLSVRVLSLQTLAHALTFAALNAGNFAERALLASDTAATAALGLSWTVFCLLNAFTTNVVNVGQLVVARCTGDGDDRGARAAAGQALLLAVGGGAVALVLAVAAGAAAVFAVGPARDAALFLAMQGLALGPLLGAKAFTAYFAGTMRLGPRWLAAVSAPPVVVHLALVWLLAGALSWSVAGAGLARLGAAVAAVAAAFAVARAEFRGSGGPVRRPDWALLGKMFREGSVLGSQQVVASLMVMLLYLRAAGAGDVTSAALTLTHSGVYPLLFSFAWGGSQATSAAAAQAIGRGDAGELARVTRLGLGLFAVLAFALPWGAFIACGRQTLAWAVAGNPAGGAVLAASLRFMALLAVFFVFDSAINFLSALLTAAEEQAYLLKATAAAAAGFGLLLLALPARPAGACLMGTFITAQAAWAVLLLIRVRRRWPGGVGRSAPEAPGRRDTLVRSQATSCAIARDACHCLLASSGTGHPFITHHVN